MAQMQPGGGMRSSQRWTWQVIPTPGLSTENHLWKCKRRFPQYAGNSPKGFDVGSFTRFNGSEPYTFLRDKIRLGSSSEVNPHPLSHLFPLVATAVLISNLGHLQISSYLLAFCSASGCHKFGFRAAHILIRFQSHLSKPVVPIFNWLVISIPLKKKGSSVGMMKFTYGKS